MKIHKRLAAGITALVFVAGAVIVMMPAQKASAASMCRENDRDLARALASSNNFVEYGRTRTDSGNVTLRYSSDTGCAWGLFSEGSGSVNWGLQKAYVWLDRSWDGGSNWVGKLGETGTGWQENSAYTGAFNTVGGYNAMRACSMTSTNGAWGSTGKPPRDVQTINFGAVYCTPWFFPSRLSPNQTMGGQGFSSLSSPNNRYVLRMQDDGNLVLYSWDRAVWSSNTFVRGSILRMQDDGNLVVIAPGNRAVWASNSYGSNNRNSTLILQDDGNLVIYAPGGRPVWASNTMGR